MLQKLAAYATILTILTTLYILHKIKVTQNYCNVERFKCDSKFPHIACSYDVKY